LRVLRKVWRELYPLALILIVTVGAWILRGSLTLANFTMIYILVVLTLAIQRGTRLALAAAVVSFLSINFFLVQPYYTFLVADPREVLDLVVFFIVAWLAGRLAARARQQAADAQQRAYEQEILYRLTRSFNQLSTSTGVYDVLVNVLKSDLKARQAYVLPYTSDKLSYQGTVSYLLLQANEEVYGTLCVGFDMQPTRETMRLLNTCASQAAMALNRIDLTERARMSQQFEEADRLKTAILHAVSHDLRTPITIIKTSANNLRTLGERLSLVERAELSEAIEQETNQLDKLIGNLLDMSRLRAGALTLNSALNSLEEVAGDVAARAFQRTKQERIRLNFPSEMPLLCFDYGLMLQTLTNLIDNALRYEPPDLQIEVRAIMKEKEAHLFIANHGPSIAADEREHIFEPFYHGKHGNTGLGLPIAKGIIEAHRGRLWLEDTPGGGATFVIALPLENNHDA
jgi:two-component system, OmpR family, sensor histidine kinase KdpD